MPTLTPRAKLYIDDDDRYPDSPLRGQLCVDVEWSTDDDQPLDRESTGGWALGPDTPRNRALAQRLVRAVNDGAVHRNPRVVRDIDHNTYVQADRLVYGKRLNADLTRLGY